jgi:hypothetical protein
MFNLILKRILFILILLFSFHSFAQTFSDSLDFIITENPANSLHTVIDKQLNTYYLNSSLALNEKLERFSFRLYENFNSKFIRSTEKSIRDEQYLSLSGMYRINPVFHLGIAANSKILSDSRRIEINEASVSNAALYTIYNPISNFSLSPFWGYANNRQIGENDYGFLYGIEGIADNLEVSDFNLYSALKFRNEDISPRKNTTRFYNLVLTNRFDKDVTNVINARYSQYRKDFYYQADSLVNRQFNIINNIQSRTETDYVFEDRLRYNDFIDIFLLDVSGKITWRDIDRNTRYRPENVNSKSLFDTKINELRVELESIIYYNTSWFDGALRIIYSERDEKHVTKNFEGANKILFEERSKEENQKNNNANRASVSFTGNINFSKTDKFSFSLLQNKLKYDTPSEENFDDRDELLSIVRLRYSKMLTPFFEAFVNTEGTLGHIVYLFSEKSSNNNINRVLRLAAGGNYRGKNISSANTFEVSANYTVYDFEDLNPNFQSFSFRQFTATDSSSIKLNNKTWLLLYGYLKLSEQGNLKWASFSSRPTRFLEEIYAEPRFSVNFHDVIMSIGLRYFSLKTFNYNKKHRVIDTEYLSRGPLMEIYMVLKDILYLRLYGWYEFILIDNDREREQANLTMQINWNF